MASVKVKKFVVDKIQELNDIGGLQAPLRLAKVARPLADLDLEQAISLLDELFNNAEEVSDPTEWVCEMARQLVDDIGEEEEKKGETEEIGPSTDDQIFEGLVGQPQRVVPARPGFPALPPKGLLPRLEEEEQEGETEELDPNTDDMDQIFESLVGQPPSGIPPKRVQTQQVVPARPGCPALPPPPPPRPQHPPPSMVVPARPGFPALPTKGVLSSLEEEQPEGDTEEMDPNTDDLDLICESLVGQPQNVVPARPGFPALPPKGLLPRLEEEQQEGDTEEIGPGIDDLDPICESLIGQPQNVVPARPGFPALPPQGLLPRLEEEEQEGETEELDPGSDDLDPICESLVGQQQNVVPARPGFPALPPKGVLPRLEEEQTEGEIEELDPSTDDLDPICESLVGQPQKVVPARPGFPALPPKGVLPRLEEEQSEGEANEIDPSTDDLDLILESLVGQPPSGIPSKRVQTQQVVPARPGCPALPPPPPRPPQHPPPSMVVPARPRPPPRPPQHPPPSMVVPARPGRPALAPNSSTRPLQQSVVPARPGCPAFPPKPVHVAASSATDANTGKIKIKKQVAEYIRQLNDELELSEPLRITAIAVPLSALSVEDALNLLSGLRDGEADGCDPNSWVMAQAAAAAEVYAEEDGVEEDADEEPETKKRRIAFG